MSRTPLERASELPGLELIRSVLRDAFGVELLLADAGGALAHQKGGVRSPPCGTCRDILFTPEGFKRCDAFYRQFDHRAVSVCHAGFRAIGAVSEEGVRLIVSGLRGEETKATLTPDAQRSVSAILELVIRQLNAQNATDDSGGLWGLTGRSPQMQRVYGAMRKLAASAATVLILGESGTGKELVARALHENGPRQSGPFIAQNCAALPENLLESMLFGHVRGAFSGADRPHDGLFASATRGTLFLDEIGETSPAFQARLLRVVQDGSYVPLGSTKTQQADVRIIAATHRDLRTMIAAGTFREDLFYRLNVLSLSLPALRSRSGDVEVLCEEFVQEFEAAQPDANAQQCLLRYGWPGNVRELRAEVQRWAVQHADVDVIEPRHLSTAVKNAGGFGPRVEPTHLIRPAEEEESRTLAEAVAELEKRLIEDGLHRVKGKKAALARQLGISRTTLNERLKRYGLE